MGEIVNIREKEGHDYYYKRNNQEEKRYVLVTAEKEDFNVATDHDGRSQLEKLVPVGAAAATPSSSKNTRVRRKLPQPPTDNEELKIFKKVLHSEPEVTHKQPEVTHKQPDVAHTQPDVANDGPDAVQ